MSSKLKTNLLKSDAAKSNQKAKSHQIDMTAGPIFSKLLVFSVPLILSSLLQLLFNAADVIVVGRYVGSNALAAVGSTAPLINLLVNLFIGLTVGANVVAAGFFGAGDNAGVERTVHTSYCLSAIGGIILTFAGVIFSPQILILMGSPEDVLPLAVLYLRIYFGGIIPTVIYNFGASLLRAKGDTRRPLYILFAAGIINVILNLVFVIFFDFGVAGVSLATVVSQTFSAIFVTFLLMMEKDCFRLEFKKLRIYGDILLKILKIGVPAGVQGMIFSFSNVIIQSSANAYGAVVVAGNSASQSVEGFIYTSMNGFAQGVLTFVSQNRGAKKFDRIGKVYLRALACVVVIGGVLGSLVILFGQQVFSIFSKNQAVIDAARSRMLVIAATYYLCGMMDCTANTLRGLGYSMTPMLITLVGACGLRILYLAFFYQIPRFHFYQSIFVSYPLSWGVTFAVLLCVLAVLLRKVKTAN